MMRIKQAQVSLLRAPLLQPFRIATGQHDTLDNVLLTITLADGTKGYGEAAVASHITGETIPQTVRNLKTMANYLKGQDIGNYLTLCGYTHALLTDNRAAVAAVEMALFDAMTRYLRMPLWRVWGRTPAKFSTDITIVIGSLEETIAKTKAFYAQGFRAFKVKVGRDMDLDIQRVAAVSHIGGGSSMLIVDANQGYDAGQTLKFLKQLHNMRVRVDLIEQPVPKKDFEGLKKVTRSTKVLVCADESASSLPDAVYIIREKAAGAINLKLMKTGLVHAVAIARLAKANDVKLMIGGMMESSLAMTASAHLAAGLGGIDFIDLDTPFFIKNGLKGNPYLSRRGTYDLSKAKAGIGIIP